MIASIGEIAKTIGAIFTVVALTFAGCYAVAGDHIVPAMRAWVIAQNQPLTDTAKRIERGLIEQTLDVNIGKREAAERERDRLELDALKVQDEAERLKVNQLKRRTEDTITKLNEKIRQLEAQK